MLETLNAVTKVRQNRIEGARSMGLGPVAILFHVILPSGLPEIMTGIRDGLGLAYTVVVAAEGALGRACVRAPYGGAGRARRMTRFGRSQSIMTHRKVERRLSRRSVRRWRR